MMSSESAFTPYHAYVVQRLSGFLFVFLRKNSIGKALIKARYRLPNDNANSYIPDLSFISHEKGALVTEGVAPYMPDLAIEVQSPGQTDQFMADKARYYLEHGSRMVWLIYPDRELVEVLTPTDRQLLTREGVIVGAPVLPDFQVVVKEIFPNPSLALP